MEPVPAAPVSPPPELPKVPAGQPNRSFFASSTAVVFWVVLLTIAFLIALWLVRETIVWLVAAGFLAFANEILSFWLRTPIQLDSLFLSCAALLIILSALHFYVASLLIGTSDTKAVARIHLGEAVAFTPFAFALFFSLGEGGVLLALDLTLAAGLFLMAQRVLAHRAFGAFFFQARIKAA